MVGEAKALFRRFGEVRISTVLTNGDLLESDAGQRHRGWLLSLANRLWPRTNCCAGSCRGVACLACSC